MGIVQAQVFPDPPDPAGPTILTKGQLPPPDMYMREGMQDYANGFVSLNAIYDSSLPFATLTPQGNVVQDYGGWGGQVGGGFNIYHRLQHGLFWVSYSGSYNRFNRSEYANGTNQTFSAAYSKMLSRRWTLRATEGLNFNYNLGSTYTLLPTSGFFPSVQPYSQQAFFDTTSATLGYQATYRLSFFFGGDFFAALYQPSQAAGYVGFSGETGASYRFTRKTSLTAGYTGSHLNYSTSGITSNIQTGTLTLSHTLTRRMEIGLSAGVSQVNSSGVATIYFQGVPNTYFVQGTYKQESLTPNFTASISRTGQRSRFGVSGGEGISGGNGIYLTSRNLFVNGTANYQITPRLSLSGLVGYSRLKSLANATTSYNALNYNFTAGYQLTRHAFANLAYTGWRFPQYGTINNFNAHRLQVGIIFASRDYPLPY
jgi:hypothetical protein